jgi:hypothetical protein
VCAAGLSLGVLMLGVAGCGSGDPETHANDDTDKADDLGAQLGQAVGASTTVPATTSTAPPQAVQTLAIASVATPAEAPNGQDACQPANPTSFAASNLNDGDVETGWRMPGDATGQELTITLDGPRNIRQVGLVPGYAKVDPCDDTDRFVQNRRVLQVTWIFDDGTTVTQDLREAPEMQPVGVTATSTTIRLRIDAVTQPGGKDYTAMSEIGVRGY